ncbi:MAG TPA: hypothetical protein PKM88_00925 [bacterium]|nr:hypothetical protein [bacterium]
MTDQPAPADCFSCAHFTITYDKRFPYACRVFGFKGKELPARTVFATTGSACTALVPRPVRPAAAPADPGARGGKPGWLV